MEESTNSTGEFQKDALPKSKSRWVSCFPYGFWYEWRRLANLAFPIILTSVSNYAIVPISISFLGHLGTAELAAGGLAISIFHVAGLSFIAGLLTASDTLFSQTFGGTNKFRLGVQVQKSAVILTICCLPCCAIYIVMEPILLATNQPPLVAKYTANYLLGLIPGLFSKVYPPLFASLAANLVNALAHYLFIYKTEFGFVGSAISQSLGFMTQALTMVGYIYFSRLYRETWDAVHVELWHDWGIWFRLAIPGMIMTGLEWWVCESGSLLSGLRGENALAVQTILNNIESLIYCLFPLGFCFATLIRIGQFLGANNSEGPKSTALVSLITIVVLSALVSVVIICTRLYIPRIFSSDPAIIDSAADGLIAISCFLFVDSIVGVCSGVIRGVGMQKAGGIVCIVWMYLIGGPLGLTLLLATDLGVPGFWYGMTVGTGGEAITYITLILRINWVKMCEKAQKRTEIKFIKKTTSQEKIEEDGVDVEEGTSEASEVSGVMKEDDDEEVKACTPRIISTRAISIAIVILTIVAALICRFKLNWKSYFQSHCLLENGTLIPMITLNGTLFDQRKCKLILP